MHQLTNFYFPSSLPTEPVKLDGPVDPEGKPIPQNRVVTVNGWTLGLDVGSNSIGWMLVRDNPVPGERNVLGGVRVFPAATDQPKGPATETSRTVERRIKRGMRRQQQRRDRRRRRLLYELVRYGFLQLKLEPHATTGSYNMKDLLGYWQNQDEDFRKLIFNTDPYTLRAEGLDRELTPAEFARCLIHLNQHRGFKSNRKVGSQSDGVVKMGIERTQKGIIATGSRTLGEYLSKIEPTQRRRGRYLHRDMIRAEFDLLWKTQRDNFPNSPLSQLLTEEARMAIADKTIFWQRPFDKVSEDRVGDCIWENGQNGEPPQKRERRGHRLAHRFRIITEVDNLRFDDQPRIIRGRGRAAEKATLRSSTDPNQPELFQADDSTTIVEITKPKLGEQRDGLIADAAGRWRLGSELRAKAINYLMTHEELKLDSIHRILGLPERWSVNLASGNRPSLKGNKTEITLAAAFAPNHVHDPMTNRWDALSEEARNARCKFLLESEDNEEVARKARDEWGMNEAGIAFLLDPKNAIGPDKHGMLSLKAIQRILSLIDPEYADPQVYDATLREALEGLESETTGQKTPTSLLKVAEQKLYGTIHKRNLTRHIYGLLPFPPGTEFSRHKAIDGKGAYLTPTGHITDQPKSADGTIEHTRRRYESTDQIPRGLRNHYKVGDLIPTHQEHAEKPIHGRLPDGTELNDPLLYLEDKQPIMNPVVRKALFEVRKVVNEIIRTFGTPSKIRIELARSSRGSIEERIAFIKEQRKNEKDRERIRKAIARELGISEAAVRSSDIIAYQLWEEQGYRCIYTGDPISLHELLRGDVQVDHIIPFSQSMDDSRANRVVAKGYANREKGNRTPHEWLSGDPDKYAALLARVETLVKTHKWKPNKAKRFTREGAAEIAEDSPIIARKLVDTQYIARQLASYLSCLYPANRKYVEIGRGDITSALRSKWDLDSILWELNGFNTEDMRTVEKNRGDHRHHAIDAAVIALTSARTLQHYAWHKKQEAHWRRLKGKGEATQQDRRQFSMPLPWEGFREELKAEIDRIIVSHTPTRRVRGPLHKETYYGPTKEKGVLVVTKALTSLTPPMIPNIVDHKVRVRVVDHLVNAGVATIEPWNPVDGGERRPRDTEPLAYDHPKLTTHLLRIPDKKAIAPTMAPTDATTLFNFRKPENRHVLLNSLIPLGLADLQLESPDEYWQFTKRHGLQKVDRDGNPVQSPASSEDDTPSPKDPSAEAVDGEENDEAGEIPRVPFGDWFEIPAVTEGGKGTREIYPRCFARLHDSEGGLDEDKFHKEFYRAHPALKPLALVDGGPPLRHVRIHTVSNTAVPVIRSNASESFVEPGNNHHLAMFRIRIPEMVEDKEAMKAMLEAAGEKRWTKKMGPKPMKHTVRELIHFEARTLLEAAREKLALLRSKQAKTQVDPGQIYIMQPRREFSTAAEVELIGHLMINDIVMLNLNGSHPRDESQIFRVQKMTIYPQQERNSPYIVFRDVRSVFVDKSKSLSNSERLLTTLTPDMYERLDVDILGRVSLLAKTYCDVK